MMVLQIENGVLYGDVPDGCWNGDWEDEDRLVSLIVPECVTAIKDRAFFTDPWIRKVVIPGSVKVIGEEAFAVCSRLEELVIEEGVERIEAGAFRDCSITALSLPRNSLKYIGDEAFKFGFFRKLELPQELEYLGAASFRRNPDLEFVSVPGTVKRIEAKAFQGCALETVILQEGVEEIGEEAFSECDHLAEISFPSTLRKIGKDAVTPVNYTDDGEVYPEFLLPDRDVVIEDDWFKYVADTYHRYKECDIAAAHDNHS